MLMNVENIWKSRDLTTTIPTHVIAADANVCQKLLRPKIYPQNQLRFNVITYNQGGSSKAKTRTDLNVVFEARLRAGRSFLDVTTCNLRTTPERTTTKELNTICSSLHYCFRIPDLRES